MYHVKTRLGYEYLSHEPVYVGDRVHPPSYVPDSKPRLSEARLNFYMHYYGTKKTWPAAYVARYGVSADFSRLPEDLLKADEEKIEKFLVNIFAASSYPHVHKSSPTTAVPEIWFPTNCKTITQDYQMLWRRLDIMTKVYKNPQRGWMLRTSGSQGYVQIRPYLYPHVSEAYKTRLRELDRWVPFKYRMIDAPPLRDKVVEVKECLPDQLDGLLPII